MFDATIADFAASHAALSSRLLWDAFVVTLVAGAIALPLFALIRRRCPDLGWNMHGNVWTSPFGVSEIFIGSAIIGLVGVSISAASGGASEGEISAGALIVNAVVFHLGLSGALLFYLGFWRQMDLGELLGVWRLKPFHAFRVAVAWVLLAGAVCFAIHLIVQRHVFGPSGIQFPQQRVVLMFLESGDLAFRLAVVFSACIAAPFAEEVVFRGFLYGVTKRYSDRYFAAIFSALVFSLIHVNVAGFVPLFVLGLFFAMAYEVTGSLVVPILMHAFFNAGMIALMFVGVGVS